MSDCEAGKQKSLTNPLKVGAAYAETSVHDQKGEKKFVIEIPLLRQLGLGARIKGNRHD